MLIIIMLVLVILSQILLVVVSGSSQYGWTYKTTTSTCAGTATSPCGPDYWYKIAPTCSSSSSSSTQSPIDISQAVPNDSLLSPVYNTKGNGCRSWTQFTNNQSFEISFEGQCDNLSITYNDNEYELKEIHFHSPSEHTVGGGFTAAEAHLVHLSSTNAIVVLGIRLEVQGGNVMIGASNNTFLNTFWTAGGKSNLETVLSGATLVVNNSTVNIDPYNTFLPGRKSYYTYKGSLTTPSCTEGVTWIVFDEHVTISWDDIGYLRALIVTLPTTIASQYNNTNRPTQPLNGRVVSYYDGTHDAHDGTTTYEESDTITESFKTAMAVISLLFIVVFSFGLSLLSVKVGRLSTLTKTKNTNNVIESTSV